jgi:hypothetical protein
VLAAGSAEAGHELPFYPSYYPQEIRLEAVDPGAAPAELEKGALHAYVGRDPLAGGALPASLRSVESLGSYVVVRFNGAASAWRDREARCAAASRVVAGAPATTAYVFHPYPVTPFHADYLHHADLAGAATKARAPRAGSAPAAPPIRWRAAGQPAAAEWDAAVEELELDDLLAPYRMSLNGWLGPPWLKEGWFHAYLLHAGTLTDDVARRAVEGIYRRLQTGAHDSPRERLNLERRLVSLLGAGCERVVVGYTVRRELFNAEFSDGVENVAHDAHSGLSSPIFLRTVKLKDFPWNGWLRLGIATRPAAAWNPVGGFTDAAGRLVWFAVGDPAFFPAPQSATWIGNRVTTASVSPGTPAGMEVPRDALLPEPGTGLLREVGAGQRARVKIVYTVLTSAFHDGTPMAVADVLYPFSLAARWGVKRPAGGSEYDPVIDAGTARLREWLAGFRVVRVDSSVREFGEVKFVYVVHTIEVYGNDPGADPQQVASVAPPWSPVPWHVLALMEEAVRRGVGAFSQDEATRRGVVWLDLVRDQKVKDALASLVDDFARQGHVPPTLRGIVSAADARERWVSLQRFYRTRRHFLVTNGPYQLESWSPAGAVLSVFRDFTYPLGVGSYDRYAIPLRAYAAKVDAQGQRVEIHADVEVAQKFQRDLRIVREPLRTQTTGGETPVCRYVVVGPAGEILVAGTAPYAGRGVFAVDLGGLPRPGPYTLAVALYLGDNYVSPEVRVLPYQPGGPS